MKYRLLSSIYYENLDLYNEIYDKRYNSESTYRYNFEINKDKAFLVINNNILQAINRILKLDKEFVLKADCLPQIALKQYTKKCIIDEIKMTNDIEGVVSTRKEISEILNDINGKKKGNRLYGLVKKYELLTEEEILLKNCFDIRILYDEFVLKEVKSENKDHIPDGTIFRKDAVYVQNKTGKTIHTGLNPESKIIEVLTECLSILNNSEYNMLVSIAVFHYMFGYIHPFYDGNGRISRFISSYLLSRELHPIIAYRLSYTIKKDINNYYKNFKIVNDEKNKGEITCFVEYFFGILIESLEDLNSYLSDRIKKLKFYENRINKNLKSIYEIDDRELSILYVLVQNSLFGENGLSVEEITEIVDAGTSKVRTTLKSFEISRIIIKKQSGKKFIYDVDLDMIEKLNSN
jgi:Fic family protein